MFYVAFKSKIWYCYVAENNVIRSTESDGVQLVKKNWIKLLSVCQYKRLKVKFGWPTKKSQLTRLQDLYAVHVHNWTKMDEIKAQEVA